MAVSKRTRFEVLKRDKHTCWYCGTSAPHATLTIDHVVPVSLGGSDYPNNLVAACIDCNQGKASTPPDAASVAEVSEHAIRWQRAMERAVELSHARTDEEAAVLEAFTDKWSEWTIQGGSALVPLSPNWKETVLNYWRAGLPTSEIAHSVDIAMHKKGVPLDAVYHYFCGVARNKLRKLSEVAAQLIEDGEV